MDIWTSFNADLCAQVEANVKYTHGVQLTCFHTNIAYKSVGSASLNDFLWNFSCNDEGILLIDTDSLTNFIQL